MGHSLTKVSERTGSSWTKPDPLNLCWVLNSWHRSQIFYSFGRNCLHLVHPTWSSRNSDFSEEIWKFWISYIIVAYDKLYLEAYIIIKEIYLKINTIQLHFTLNEIQMTFEFVQCTQGWLWYSQLLQRHTLFLTVCMRFEKYY